MTFWDLCSPIYDFAQRRNRRYNEWNELAASTVQVGDAVLEVAGGTGEIAIRAARRARRVVCTDLSENMLKVARAKAKDAANIEFAVCDIYSIPFDDSAFDTVIASQILHLLEEPQRAVDELKRVARRSIVLPLCLTGEATSVGVWQIALWRRLGFKPRREFDRDSYADFLRGLGLTITDYMVLDGAMPMVVAVCER